MRKRDYAKEYRRRRLLKSARYLSGIISKITPAETPVLDMLAVTKELELLIGPDNIVT